MSFTGMNPNRRYSLLEVSGGASRLRPRSSSTSVVTVTEATPELRTVGDRRPPPTPGYTPCFVSPRLAFSTQFNYDSPIQILTCRSNNVLKPVSKWTSRFYLCSGKGLFITVMLSLCFIGCMWMGGKEVPVPPGAAQHLCDAHGTGADCGGAHPVTSSLQKFLKDASTHEHTLTDQHRTKQEESEQVVAAGGQEERNYRPRVPTVQGQYEDNVREHLGDDPSSTVNPTQRGEETLNHMTLSSEDLQAVREGLARAKRSLIAEGRDPMQSNQDDMQKSMRVVEEEAILPQDFANRSPQPQYEPRGQPSPHYEAARPSQPQHGLSRHHQPNFAEDSRPHLRKDSTRRPQNSRLDFSNQNMPGENRQNHFRQPQLRQDTLGQSQSLADGSQRHYMPDEARKTNLRPLPSQNEDHRQPQLQQDATGQTHHSQEDRQREQMTEEVHQSHFRQVPPQHEVHKQPQLQQNINEQLHSSQEDSQREQMTEEVHQGHFRQVPTQHEVHKQPQLQQNINEQLYSSQEDSQREQVSEEARQSHFRQVPTQHEALGQPQPQEDTSEQPHRTPEDLQRQDSPEDERQRQQQALDQLYIQHMNLERNNYHREKQIVGKEISDRELLRHREQERLWEEQRRQTHNKSPQGQPRTPPQQRTPGSGLKQRESGRPHQEETRHREEFIPYDERHPAWRDQRLPRGVNPKRYYIHNDL
ncbi:trichohyalin-like isoform X2 [Eriocheir sinensis]|uniref:trichohyalin-like isoform X2 n=1 Tax=Eriocheir sinensis TaxID=95602 RepID=UPI0021CA8D03|nr:trichohyalin-like isoform X2 [Eriocheir sinensis]